MYLIFNAKYCNNNYKGYIFLRIDKKKGFYVWINLPNKIASLNIEVNKFLSHDRIEKKTMDLWKHFKTIISIFQLKTHFSDWSAHKSNHREKKTMELTRWKAARKLKRSTFTWNINYSMFRNIPNHSFAGKSRTKKRSRSSIKVFHSKSWRNLKPVNGGMDEKWVFWHGNNTAIM